MALGGRKSIDPDAVIFGLQQIANSGTDSAQRRFPIRQRVKGARTVDSIVVPSAVNSNYQNAAGRVAEGGQCFCKRNPTVLGQLPLSIEDGTLFADCGCLEIEGQTFLRLELDSLLQECLLARNDILELHPIPHKPGLAQTASLKRIPLSTRVCRTYAVHNREIVGFPCRLTIWKCWLPGPDSNQRPTG